MSICNNRFLLCHGFIVPDITLLRQTVLVPHPNTPDQREKPRSQTAPQPSHDMPHKGSDTVRSSSAPPASQAPEMSSSHKPKWVYIHDGFLLCHWFIGSDVALPTWRLQDGKDHPEKWVYVQYSSLTLSRIYWIWCCSTGLKPFTERRRSPSSAAPAEASVSKKNALGRAAAAAAAWE